MRAPVNDATCDILESLGLKPYVIQRHDIAGNAWVIHSQFDTLEEAQDALGQLPLYGKCIYRVAAAAPHDLVAAPRYRRGLVQGHAHAGPGAHRAA